ncbi:MAG: SDR family oxidoreductase [Saprospiraceae bacterium]|nr:SDR family oxidoreductase [Saprospiraceae bacterium]MCB0625581.1 SDR family oxidoreductase [Saprospiraceae bacterium]MCB0679137.1 SDR family oxidoreductase [Saprospiraceae bacterium]MCB0682173.1 SDR family oxidoreductase [Saprospiraceae bacterium]
MKILLTGATGYIGKRLLLLLTEAGHDVYCVVRDRKRFQLGAAYRRPERIQVVECDLLDPEQWQALPVQVDAAYYLVHGMSLSAQEFNRLEKVMAEHFRQYLDRSTARQAIYLSGIANDEGLSRHLSSRYQTEQILSRSKVPLTVLRAAIIIGSGSASFEIIRDLVEKLPVMIAPKWLNTRCQPIAIREVLQYLMGVLDRTATFGQVFDIGGPDVLTYREMLYGYARSRGLRRWIMTVPIFSPRLSSYWLYFVTSTSYPLAVSLVGSMHNEVVCGERRIDALISTDKIAYQEAIELALGKIEQNAVLSSWKDAISSGQIDERYTDFIQVPQEGCFHDRRRYAFPAAEHGRVLENLWRIGGRRGWYYANFLWKIRGLIDKLIGGVGLRRGRRDQAELNGGDALDFWRVLVADRKSRRLLLFAEMKLPGEAWLEFRLEAGDQGEWILRQDATFRPRGLWGRMYWYAVLPFHGLVFPGMAKGIIRYRPDDHPGTTDPPTEGIS